MNGEITLWFGDVGTKLDKNGNVQTVRRDGWTDFVSMFEPQKQAQSTQPACQRGQEDRRNQTRFLIDDTHTIYRQLKDSEYHEGMTSVEEMAWYNRCPQCGSYQGIRSSEEEARSRVRLCGYCARHPKLRHKMSGWAYGMHKFSIAECGEKRCRGAIQITIDTNGVVKEHPAEEIWVQYFELLTGGV